MMIDVVLGLSAAPLRDDVVAPPRGMVHNDQVNLPRRIPAHDHRRQGTEPSRRFLVDLNTGLLKERASEMERRVGHGKSNTQPAPDHIYTSFTHINSWVLGVLHTQLLSTYTTSQHSDGL